MYVKILFTITSEFGSDFRAVYNISKAVEAIPRAREVHLQQKLIIFIHGFTDDPTKGSFSTISDSFLKQGNFRRPNCKSNNLREYLENILLLNYKAGSVAFFVAHDWLL